MENGQLKDACGSCFEDLAKWRTRVAVASKIWRNGGRVWHLLRRFGEMEDACGSCVEDLAKWRTYVTVAWKIWRNGGRMWRLRGRFGEIPGGILSFEEGSPRRSTDATLP